MVIFEEPEFFKILHMHEVFIAPISLRSKSSRRILGRANIIMESRVRVLLVAAPTSWYEKKLPVYTYMVGLPGETSAEYALTIAAMLRLLASVRVAVLEPYIALPYSPLSASTGLDNEDWDPSVLILKGRFERFYYQAMFLAGKNPSLRPDRALFP